MEKTNVLIITPSLHIGGLEMVIAHLCRYVDKEKFNISVCCVKEIGSIGKHLIKDGYLVVGLKKPRYLKNNYISWLQILKLIKKNNVHVLHTHTLNSLLDAVLCKLLFFRKVRVIHTFHFGNYPNRSTHWLYNDKILSRFADQLVAVGNEQKEKIKETLNIDDRAIVTVWNGVPESPISQSLAMVEKYKNTGRIIIGTACTLIEQKGLTYLLEVAHLLKQKGRKVIFLVAGEGHLREDLEKKITQLDLKDDVILLGWVDNAAEKFIPYIDIFFLPSLWEAMSIVVLEAMEAGKPVVVTNVGENGNAIKDGIDGFIAESRDIQGMSKILDHLIVDSQLRKQVGKMARAKVRDQFSVEKMVSAYQNLYTSQNHQIERAI